jgi:hypothetical protein
MANLCPTEVAAKWVFEMGEPKHKYTFAASGEPEGRPNKDDCRRYVAQNFFACAHFFEIYCRAFNEILMGWPLEEAVQVNPDCLFDGLLSRQWSKEESGRRGAHTHGILTQPFFQAENLRRRFGEGTEVQQAILLFGEALMRAYLPSARDCRVAIARNVSLLYSQSCALCLLCFDYFYKNHSNITNPSL